MSSSRAGSRGRDQAAFAEIASATYGRRHSRACGIQHDGSPSAVGHTIEEDAGRGLVTTSNATPTVVGNSACDNGTNLFTLGDAGSLVDDTNESCEDAPA